MLSTMKKSNVPKAIEVAPKADSALQPKSPMTLAELEEALAHIKVTECPQAARMLVRSLRRMLQRQLAAAQGSGAPLQASEDDQRQIRADLHECLHLAQQFSQQFLDSQESNTSAQQSPERKESDGVSSTPASATPTGSPISSQTGSTWTPYQLPTALDLGATNQRMSATAQQPAAEVNILNCVDIFFAYCQALLGPEFDTMKLLEYRGFNRDGERMLHAVQYPRPDGFTKVSKKQVKRSWEGRNLHDVLAQYHSPKLQVTDSQKRWFLYAVVLDIVGAGYLDDQNKPTAHVLAEAAAGRARGVYDVEFPESPPQRSLGDGILEWQQAATRAVENAEAWPNQDPKSLLNELRHKMPGVVLVYETELVAHKSSTNSFQSSLYLQHGEELYKFQGEVALGKKPAEQSAALEALRFVSSGNLWDLLEGTSRNATMTHSSPRSDTQGLVPWLQQQPKAPRQPTKTTKTHLSDLVQVQFADPNCMPSVKYTYQPLRCGWQATARIDTAFGVWCYTGGYGANKRDAEELAALAALEGLRR